MRGSAGWVAHVDHRARRQHADQLLHPPRGVGVGAFGQAPPAAAGLVLDLELGVAAVTPLAELLLHVLRPRDHARDPLGEATELQQLLDPHDQPLQHQGCEHAGEEARATSQDQHSATHGTLAGPRWAEHQQPRAQAGDHPLSEQGRGPHPGRTQRLVECRDGLRLLPSMPSCCLAADPIEVLREN